MGLGETGWSYELDSSGSVYGPVAGCCEHGNETSEYINGAELLD
jgi:hypothetical protein